MNNDDYEYKIEAAPVVYTNKAPEPFNPLNRPEIRFAKPIITLVLYVLLNVFMAFAYNSYFTEQTLLYKTIAIITIILVNIAFLAILAKKAIIWLIHLYQRYAPDEVRLKCVFEPSCSEYVIAAIRKYGVIKGIIKGVDRLFRCHPPNGGHDEP